MRGRRSRLFPGLDSPDLIGPPTAAPPAAISMQPEPLLTLVANIRGVTAIARTWEPGDSALCRLCPQCCADHESGVCLVIVGTIVPDSAAAIFSVHGLPRE